MGKRWKKLSPNGSTPMFLIWTWKLISGYDSSVYKSKLSWQAHDVSQTHVISASHLFCFRSKTCAENWELDLNQTTCISKTNKTKKNNILWIQDRKTVWKKGESKEIQNDPVILKLKTYPWSNCFRQVCA